MRATWSTPTSNIQKLVLYHHHANWALLDRRVQALYIRGLQLRMISSTAEHMSRVERAPSTRERATKCFSPTGLREGRQRACHKPKRNSQDPVIHFYVLESARSITQLLFCPDLPSSDICYFQRIQFTIESHFCAWRVTANPNDVLRYPSVTGIWYFPRRWCDKLYSYHENVITWVWKLTYSVRCR